MPRDWSISLGPKCLGALPSLTLKANNNSWEQKCKCAMRVNLNISFVSFRGSHVHLMSNVCVYPRASTSEMTCLRETANQLFNSEKAAPWHAMVSNNYALLDFYTLGWHLCKCKYFFPLTPCHSNSYCFQLTSIHHFTFFKCNKGSTRQQICK